jgi:uncharacterized lipoprotein YehR (DUF1307 family)
MKTFFFILMLCFLLTACFDSNICQDYVNNNLRKQKINMVVTNKYKEDRYYRIIGVNKKGIIDTTEEQAVEIKLFLQAEIGDTLIKEIGKVDIYLKKKDTTIEYPCHCDGKRIY